MDSYPKVSITDDGVVFEIAPGVFTSQRGAEEFEKAILEEIKTNKFMENKLDANSVFMEYNSTDKVPGQLFGHKDIKLSFLQKEYSMEGESITCKIACKLNISKLEKYFKLTDKLKRELFYPQMECYTIMEQRPKVAYVNHKGKTCMVIVEEPVEEYNYYDTFVVRATVKPEEGDTFDEKTGRMLAESKAKAKAYERARQVETKIAELFYQVADAFEDYATDMAIYGAGERWRYRELGGIPIDDGVGIYMADENEEPDEQ
jgi:hypothetical protein